MKKCSTCNEVLSSDCFYDKKRSKVRADGTVHNWVGKYAKCKACTNKINTRNNIKYKEYYRDYRERNKEKISANKRQHYIKNKVEWVKILKTLIDLECSKCGYNENFAALDFHHKDPREKENTVHQLIKSGPPTPEKLTLLEKEVTKCIVLCSNCHRVEHNKYDIFGIINELRTRK